MVQHIVLWNLKPELSAAEREAAGTKIKEILEAVKDKVDGVISLEVKINPLSGSNRDIALLSCFESEEALNAYQIHPEHQAASVYIRSVTCERACFDYR